jgi:GR25 family glycosyltransferase involved in LPS biosynthesis
MTTTEQICKIIDINGFNNTFINNSIVYYINLDERIDRLFHIQNELESVFDKEIIQRIQGRKHENGAIGCTQSHVDTIIKFLKSNKDLCFVFEDDFQFLYPKNETVQIINNICSSLLAPDNIIGVVMLTYNSLGIVLELNTMQNNLSKMSNGRTTAGYIVTKSYAKQLLENFLSGLLLLTETSNRFNYAIDMYWMPIQQDKFAACVPCLGTQYNSYSDIENKTTEYIQCNTCIVFVICKKELYNPSQFTKCPFMHIHKEHYSKESIEEIKKKYPNVKYMYKTNLLESTYPLYWTELYNVYKYIMKNILIGKKFPFYEIKKEVSNITINHKNTIDPSIDNSIIILKL